MIRFLILLLVFQLFTIGVFAQDISNSNPPNVVLILIDEFNENLYLSSRNIPHVLVVEAKHADPVSLVHFQKVIATSAAIKQLEGMFA